MRRGLDRQKLNRFLQALGSTTDRPTRIYLTGGATALLLGWRDTTIDIDVKIDPENDDILRALSGLKEELNINIELASPSDFIPEAPGWESRSKFIAQEGVVTFYHYDFYAQALSKIERFHDRDVRDVKEMLRRGIIEPGRLRELFGAIDPLLYRFPAISQRVFKHNLESLLGDTSFRQESPEPPSR